MSKVNGNIKISYEWREALSGSLDIQNKDHIQALHESAEDQIREAFSKQEKKHGELKDNIYMGGDDPEDGVDYIGSWRVEIND